MHVSPIDGLILDAGVLCTAWAAVVWRARRLRRPVLHALWLLILSAGLLEVVSLDRGHHASPHTILQVIAIAAMTLAVLVSVVWI